MSKCILIKSASSQALLFKNVTVSTDSWQTLETAVVEGFGYKADIVLEGVTENHLVTLIPSQATNDLGILSVEADSYNGGVCIYAKSIPTTSLVFNVIKAEKI